MNFSRGLTSTEYLFLAFFLLIYLYYFYRVFKAAKQIKGTATGSIFKFIIRSIYLGAMSLALLGPNFGVTDAEARASGKDIYIAFDLSESMNANDVEPSRLDRANGELLGMLNQFKQDRIGVIVFNSDAQIFTPLTFDEEVVKNNIRNLKTSMLDKGSTDFNPVLKLIGEKLSSDSKNRGKIAIIVSDGEVHYPVSSKELKFFKEKKIQLFFVAVGSLYGSKIPKVPGYKLDKQGAEIVTTLDIAKINVFSKIAGGEYFVLDNERNELPQLAEKTALVVSTADDPSRQSVTYNKYLFFVLIALIFAAIDFLITVKILRI